jgi:hypothetical protein
MLGCAGASEAAMRRATCERGWVGWRRNTVGGSVSLGDGDEDDDVLKVEVREPRGMMSLKRWEEVGESFPTQ